MPQENIIQVYDQNRNRLAFLQNAFNIGYRKTLNSLWYASFCLPASDPKNKHCRPFNFVELYDGPERVELFRIIGADMTRSTQAVTVYQAEHVLATLLDDVLYKYHQIGNVGVLTTTVIRYILDRQTVKNWQLGRCDFARQFEYKFENENLLSSLFAVPKPFVEGYIWDWDTKGYPWVLNLRLMDTGGEAKSEIRYGKNMTEITKTTDSTNIITRLYALGYGEGDNQLDITSVNGGRPYLDAPTIPTWGVKASILVDRRFEDPQSLMAYAQQILNSAQNPYVSYSAQAVDLYKITGQRYDKFIVGDMVRIVDREDGIHDVFPIVEIEKNDLTGNPGAISVTIANKTKDLSGSITDLQNRAMIDSLYAQGATNQVLVNFADNADKDNPALLKLYVPESMVRVNSCVLNFEFEPFRAYERGVASTQQDVSSTSSSNQMAYSSSYESTPTQSTSVDSSKVQSTTTESASYPSTSSGGSSTQVSDAVTLTAQNVVDQSQGGYGAANHNHGINPGVQLMINNGNWKADANGNVSGGQTMGFVASGAHIHQGHTHTVSIPSHQHTVTIPAHNHSITIPSHYHTVNIPGHSHSVTIPGHAHSVTIPAHTHEMQYGIYKSNSAQTGRLYVNGKYIRDVSPNTDINLAGLLADAKTGKIARNQFHRIEIYPIAAGTNTQGLTRIVAHIFMQIFTNSRGSGDF